MPSKFPASLLLLLVVATIHAQNPARTALVGATLVDVGRAGRSTHDVDDAVVLIENGIIQAIGVHGQLAIPDGYQRIDLPGRFLTPGLIDGFAVLNNQAYANTFLAAGITSIIGVTSLRRGPMFRDADPGPDILPLEDVGAQRAPLAEHLARVDRLADEGGAIALLMYRLDRPQLRAVIKRCRERGLGTIGELAYASYYDGIDLGIDAFVHTTRYSLALASRQMQLGIVDEPFSDQMESAKWQYYRWLSGLNIEDAGLRSYARRLGESRISLMPTSSLLYLDRPGSSNPWLDPITAVVDPTDVNRPADRKTGRHVRPPDKARAYGDLSRATIRLDRVYRAAGARYLAGSATDVWGTMPGFSLHTELASLVDVGLDPREALAAATSNFTTTFGWRDRGKIEPGRRADILVLASDPRLDVSHLRDIEIVFLAGRRLDPRALLD